MTVRIVALGTVKPENLNAFKDHIALVTGVVREKEAAGTLVYDFLSAGADEGEWIIHEAYADAAALLAHLQNLGENLTKIGDVFTVNSVLLSGEVPAELVEQFKAMGSVRYYGNAISELS
jgi:quinol monooxygenase YgiN